MKRGCYKFIPSAFPRLIKLTIIFKFYSLPRYMNRMRKYGLMPIPSYLH